MTTAFAPPTIPSVETGTPPREWSQSVLASKPAADTPPASLETQGRSDMPGSQPQEASHPSQTPQTSPTSGKDRGGRRVSLPSAELTGAQPSERTGGVGALPGNLSESSVALLPDERQESTQEYRSASPRQRRDTIKLSAADGDDEPEKENVPQVAVLSKDKGESAVPMSFDHPVQSRGTNVAEVSQSGIPATDPQVGSQKGLGEITSEQAPGEQRRAVPTVAPTAEPAQGPGLASKFDQEKQAGGIGGESAAPVAEDKGGYGGDYHPALLHPPPPGASVAEYQGPTGAQRDAQDMPATKTAQQAAEGVGKKPGFMAMFKGEMKILAGKVKRDEHEVEEGKRLFHREM